MAINHSGHSHDNTPKGRAACRKAMAAGTGPAQADDVVTVRTKRGAKIKVSFSAENAMLNLANKGAPEAKPDPFGPQRERAQELIKEWTAKATEVDVETLGPTLMGDNQAFVFKGRNGALVAVIGSLGRMHVTRLSTLGLKSPVLTADVPDVLEKIA